MKLGIVEEPVTGRHGVYLGIGKVQPLDVRLGTLCPVEGAPFVTVYNPWMFMAHQGCIVQFDLVDGVYILLAFGS